MDPSQRRRKNNFPGKSGQRHEKNNQNRTLFLKSKEKSVVYLHQQNLLNASAYLQIRIISISFKGWKAFLKSL